MLKESKNNVDVMIVGAGMVGASLALALAPLGLRIMIVDPLEDVQLTSPDYDDRSIALTYGSRLILQSLGLWESLGPRSWPIKHVHVSQQGHFGVMRFAADKEGVPVLGHVVPAYALMYQLRQALKKHDNIMTCFPARVVGVSAEEQGASLVLDEGAERHWVAPLLVAADGAQSTIRRLQDLPCEQTDYGQHAVVANVSVSHPKCNQAYERFTTKGPVALLPRNSSDYGMVYTVDSDNIDSELALTPKQWLEKLQTMFGYRVGRFLKIGKRQHYPLKMTWMTEQVYPSLLFMGNAAHSLNPIAAQGFNLGLRDVETLRRILTAKPHQPVSESLMDYKTKRQRDQRITRYYTHGLSELFSKEGRCLGHLRGLGLLGLDALGPVRRIFAKQAMGVAG